MSRRATLLLHYPSGQSYYEIDGIFYMTRDLTRLPFNRQSRDPFVTGPFRLTEIATITPETRFVGASFLIAARLPDFIAPDDPRTISGAVILDAVGPEIRISPLTPRQADDWAFVGPIRNYAQLAIPDLTRGIGPTDEQYPRLPDRVAPGGFWAVLARLRGTLHQARNWAHGQVSLPLADFNAVATDMFEDGEIDTRLHLEMPGSSPPRISPSDAGVLRQLITNMGSDREAAISTLSRTLGIHRSDLRALFTEEAPIELSQREISFERAGQMLTQNLVVNFIVDPLNQEGVRPGNTRVTLIGVDGREYDVETKYDPVGPRILPPN